VNYRNTWRARLWWAFCILALALTSVSRVLCARYWQEKAGLTRWRASVLATNFNTSLPLDNSLVSLALTLKIKETKSSTFYCRLARNYLFKFIKILTKQHKTPYLTGEHYFFLVAHDFESLIVGNTHQPRETYLTIKHTGTILSGCQNFLSANT
jgi:hypothetical protein